MGVMGAAPPNTRRSMLTKVAQADGLISRRDNPSSLYGGFSQARITLFSSIYAFINFANLTVIPGPLCNSNTGAFKALYGCAIHPGPAA
jgi:hypothetical protein